MEHLSNVKYDPCASAWPRATFHSRNIAMRYDRGRFTKHYKISLFKTSLETDCDGRLLVMSSIYYHFPHISEQLFYMTEPFLAEESPSHIVLMLKKKYGSPWLQGILSAISQRFIEVDVGCHKHGERNQPRCFSDLFYTKGTSPTWFRTVDGCQNFKTLVQRRFDLTGNEGPTAVIVDRRKRRVLNINDVARVVEEHLKFKPVVTDFELMSFEQQVRSLFQVKYFFAAHGAGMVNIAFLPKGAFVIEFFPYNFVPNMKWYDLLATQCGHHHIALFSNNKSHLPHMHCAKKFLRHNVNDCMALFRCRVCMKSADFNVDLISFSQVFGKVTG